MTKTLFDKANDLHNRSWCHRAYYKVGTYDSDETVTDAEGQLVCSCDRYQRNYNALTKGNRYGTHPWCQHIFSVVQHREDAGFLLKTTDERSGPHDSALPLDVILYWNVPAVAGPRWSVVTAGLMRPVTSHCNIVCLRPDIFEVYAPTGAFCGMAFAAAPRATLREMVAPELITHALDTACVRCDEVADYSEDILERFGVLARGAWMVEHHNVCPSCSDDDLIPNI